MNRVTLQFFIFFAFAHFKHLSLTSNAQVHPTGNSKERNRQRFIQLI